CGVIHKDRVALLARGAALVAGAAGTTVATGQISRWFPAEPATPAIVSQGAPVVACFAPGTDPAYVRAVTTFLNLRNQQIFGGVGDYHLAPQRWPGTLGTPTTLTWSFAPDGVVVSSGEGEP